MNEDADVDTLTPEEEAGYRALGAQGPEPPAALENRVTEALRTRGLLAPRRRSRLLPALAAGLVLFAAGTLVGHRWPTPIARPAGSRFVFFLEDPRGVMVEKDEPDRVREYSAWAREQRAAGRLVGGDKLEPTAVSLDGGTTEAASVGPEEVGGYFVVVAPNLESALAVARTCPHLRHGGRIVVRPIASL